MLQCLPPRGCYVKHKIEGGIIPIQTVEIENVCEALGFDEDEFLKILNKYQFGRRYFISREELAASIDQGKRILKKKLRRGERSR